MKKIIMTLLTVFCVMSAQNMVFANTSINKVISESGINKGSIAISIKDITTGKPVYQLNQNVPMHPASTQKIITYTASSDTLGKDYQFRTALYKDNKNNLYIKLGADPYLVSRNLKRFMKTAKDKKILEPKTIYIDDYILDSVEWGEGWQWDDDLNILMPKFSSYNLDGNLLDIVIRPTTEGAPADVHTNVFYPTTFMNLVTTGSGNKKGNSVVISHDSAIGPEVLKIEGTVNTQFIQKIPVRYPKRYFKFRLDDAIKSAKLYYYGSYPQMKLPSQNVYLIDEITNPLERAREDIFIRSSNLAAETVFKLAGGKYVNNTGALKNSSAMLDNYFKKNGLNPDNIRIVDGSGVSKNNLMTADFMTDFLINEIKKDSEYKMLFPTADEGTLEARMLYFKNNLRAKTGTLADISAISGYLTSKNGKTYAFDIMINDAKSKSSDKKMLEEYILRALYNCY